MIQSRTVDPNCSETQSFLSQSDNASKSTTQHSKLQAYEVSVSCHESFTS